jgi:hypothetical protein
VRSNVITATAVSIMLAACGGGQDLESLGPPPEASPTGNVSPATPSPVVASGASGATGASGTPLPTTSPGITGSVNVGNASITVSGALQTSQTALPLSSPTIYSPPPGAFALAWNAGAAGFALGGTSFFGTRPTSGTLRLTFFIHSASGTASFASDDGGCDVTVTTAEVSTFEGTFSCVGIEDVNGSIVVDAQGTFSASE